MQAERRELMRQETECHNSMMVLEAGAAWPQWMHDYQRQAPNAVVVAHAMGESMGDLSARVSRRLAELKGILTVAIVACAPTLDPEHLAAREMICRSLLQAMRPDVGGEVVLAARDTDADEAKHALFELAGALCEGLSDSTRTVRVRFSSARSVSGIVAKPAAAARPVQNLARLGGFARS